jgi:hypothetical protein
VSAGLGFVHRYDSRLSGERVGNSVEIPLCIQQPGKVVFPCCICASQEHSMPRAACPPLVLCDLTICLWIDVAWSGTLCPSLVLTQVEEVAVEDHGLHMYLGCHLCIFSLGKDAFVGSGTYGCWGFHDAARVDWS